MSDYKCINPFLSNSGKSYKYGSEINYNVYYHLLPSERVNFTRIIQDQSPDLSSPSNDDSSSLFSSFLNSDTSDSSLDFGSDSSSSSDSGFDFGGGDTGGGGVSGDW
jgi:uncharacterized membrane protein YgcG